MKTSLFAKKVNTAKKEAAAQKEKEKRELVEEKKRKEEELVEKMKEDEVRYIAEKCIKQLVEEDTEFKKHLLGLFKRKNKLILKDERYSVFYWDEDYFHNCEIALTKEFKIFYIDDYSYSQEYLYQLHPDIRGTIKSYLLQMQTPEGVIDFFIKEFGIR